MELQGICSHFIISCYQRQGATPREALTTKTICKMFYVDKTSSHWVVPPSRRAPQYFIKEKSFLKYIGAFCLFESTLLKRTFKKCKFSRAQNKIFWRALWALENQYFVSIELCSGTLS